MANNKFTSINATEVITKLLAIDGITQAVNKGIDGELTLKNEFYAMVNITNPSSPLNSQARVATFDKLADAYEQQLADGETPMLGDLALKVEYNVVNAKGDVCNKATLSAPVILDDVFGF